MDTRFELNIKRVGIKGDDSALYLFLNEKLVLKLEYEYIEAAVRFLAEKSGQQQLPSRKSTVLDVMPEPNDEQ